MERVRILLADDSDAVRKSLRLALETEPGFQGVGEATDGQQALELARRLRPHVVLMEPAAPEAEGVEAARRIVQSYPGTAVIAYSVCSDDENFARRMLEAGAAGLLTKGAVSVEELVSAIGHAAETERGSGMRRRKLKRSRRRDKNERPVREVAASESARAMHAGSAGLPLCWSIDCFRKHDARPRLPSALLLPKLVRDQMPNRVFCVPFVDDTFHDEYRTERAVCLGPFAIAFKLHPDGRIQPKQAALLVIQTPPRVPPVNGRWPVGMLM